MRSWRRGEGGHLRQHESRHEFHDEGVHVRRPGGTVVALGELLEGPGGALEVGTADLHPVRRLARLHAAQRRVQRTDVVQNATQFETNVHRLVGVAWRKGKIIREAGRRSGRKEIRTDGDQDGGRSKRKEIRT